MSSDNKLSFAPDRKSVQGATFQFSDQPSGFSGQRGYSTQDSLAFKLDKIYQTKFPDVSQALRSTLVKILVPDVPLMHRNLDMIAVANSIIYSMRVQFNMTNIDQLTPELYKWYFDQFAWSIMGDINGKNNLQENLARAKFKATLLRYIYYVWKHTQS
jgi:hypothetical protein